MKILLTGASGFIGDHFLSLYKTYYDITAFSFSNNRAIDANMDDVTTIIHLAALVHNMSDLPFAEYAYHNVQKTIELAVHAKKSGVKNFIFMSTIKVYGDMKNNTCFDETSGCFPTDNYGKSKLLAEESLLELADDTFSVSVIRTPVVYGAGVKANILSLIKLVEKSPILPFANIYNKRSFVYVENLCALVDRLIEHKQTGIYLASDGNAVSTTDLISTIKHSLNKNILIFSFPLLTYIVKILLPSFYERLYGSLCLDSTSTCRKLNFVPPFSMSQGIDKTVEWYLNDR